MAGRDQGRPRLQIWRSALSWPPASRQMPRALTVYHCTMSQHERTRSSKRLRTRASIQAPYLPESRLELSMNTESHEPTGRGIGHGAASNSAPYAAATAHVHEHEQRHHSVNRPRILMSPQVHLGPAVTGYAHLRLRLRRSGSTAALPLLTAFPPSSRSGPTSVEFSSLT